MHAQSLSCVRLDGLAHQSPVYGIRIQHDSKGVTSPGRYNNPKCMTYLTTDFQNTPAKTGQNEINLRSEFYCI